jgi:hypothetical protein
MNVKVVNLVAVQFGVFVGMMSWLAYSHFDSVEPRIAALERQERPVNSISAVAPISDLGSQVTRALEDDADREQDQSIGEQPAPAVPPHQYSPEAVQQYTALATQQYYQQIAPRRYASANVENAPIVAARYAKVEQKPALASTEYEDAPESVAYDEPAQVAAYAQPYPFIAYPQQLVVFSNGSNGRRFANRCRPTRRSNTSLPLTDRRPERGECRPNNPTLARSARPTGVGHHRNVDASAWQPARGFAGRGRR